MDSLGSCAYTVKYSMRNKFFFITQLRTFPFLCFDICFSFPHSLANGSPDDEGVEDMETDEASSQSQQRSHQPIIDEEGFQMVATRKKKK